MNVKRSIKARFFSAFSVPYLRRICSTLGNNLLFSHQSLAAPPISIGNVATVGRYIPKPNEVPIPVAHSTNAPNKNPKPKAYQSP